jgi:tetratricopeptide (TPR) repeat protein
MLFTAVLSSTESWAICARSRQLYAEQIELDHRLGNRSQGAVGLGNLGADYLGMGLSKQARSLIEEASRIARALGARRFLAFDLMNLAKIHGQSGYLRRAHEFAEEALQEIAPT